MFAQRDSRTIHPQTHFHPHFVRWGWRRARRSPHSDGMNSSNGILAVVVDDFLLRDVDRVAAAASVRVVHVYSPSSRKAWLAASAVVLDLAGARRCAELGLPRRDRVLVVGTAEPNPEHWH